jgi:multiple antibiotic resistance protein
MLSGPGSIAVCISLFTGQLSFFDMGLIFLGFVLVALAAYIILMSSLRLTRFLGRPGMAALARIMGFITLAIGVNFIATAIKALFSGVETT